MVGKQRIMGALGKNWETKQLEICCSPLVREDVQERQDYVNKCLILVTKYIHRKFEVWSGQPLRRKIVIEKTVS